MPEMARKQNNAEEKQEYTIYLTHTVPVSLEMEMTERGEELGKIHQIFNCKCELILLNNVMTLFSAPGGIVEEEARAPNSLPSYRNERTAIQQHL